MGAVTDGRIVFSARAGRAASSRLAGTRISGGARRARRRAYRALREPRGYHAYPLHFRRLVEGAMHSARGGARKRAPPGRGLGMPGLARRQRRWARYAPRSDQRRARPTAATLAPATATRGRRRGRCPTAAGEVAQARRRCYRRLTRAAASSSRRRQRRLHRRLAHPRWFDLLADRARSCCSARAKVRPNPQLTGALAGARIGRRGTIAREAVASHRGHRRRRQPRTRRLGAGRADAMPVCVRAGSSTTAEAATRRRPRMRALGAEVGLPRRPPHSATWTERQCPPRALAMDGVLGCSPAPTRARRFAWMATLTDVFAVPGGD